jgi:hypothetical protein
MNGCEGGCSGRNVNANRNMVSCGTNFTLLFLCKRKSFSLLFLRFHGEKNSLSIVRDLASKIGAYKL